MLLPLLSRKRKSQSTVPMSKVPEPVIPDGLQTSTSVSITPAEAQSLLIHRLHGKFDLLVRP